MRIERRFHIGCQDRPPGWYGRCDRQQIRRFSLKNILMWMQREYVAAEQIFGSGRYSPDGRIAVFHRKGEIARLARRAHALPLAFRYRAACDQPLGTPADGRIFGRNADLSGLKRRKALGAKFRFSGLDVPKGARHHDLALTAPYLPVSGNRGSALITHCENPNPS
jgi:hypothetical protein